MSNELSSLFSSYLYQRQLSFCEGKLQFILFNKKGKITESTQLIEHFDIGVSIYEAIPLLEPYQKAILLLKEVPQKLTIPKVNFKDSLFDIQLSYLAEVKIFECVLINKNDFYLQLQQLEQEHEAAQIELMNEKLELTMQLEQQKLAHQRSLIALNEQLSVDWTNALVNPIKEVSTNYFIQYGIDETLENLALNFEQISGVCLLPDFNTLPKTKIKVGYLGDRIKHKMLIQKISRLIEFEYVSEIGADVDFLFIEESSLGEIQKTAIPFCLIQNPTNTINQTTDRLIFEPLYPNQVYEQLLAHNKTSSLMNYHEKIDISIIYDLVDNEPMLVQNMLQILHKNLNEYPSQLREEFQKGQLDDLRQTIHKFKSCTAYTGLNEFNTTLSEIEASQENGWTIAQIEEKLNFVLQAIPVIRAQVQEKLDQLQ